MNIIKCLLRFGQAYWLDILIVLLFVGILVWLIKRGKTNAVKSIVLALVTKAEQQLGSKTGHLKFNTVYNSLPIIIRLLFTQKELYKLIEDAVKELKKQLESKNANLLDYKTEVLK